MKKITFLLFTLLMAFAINGWGQSTIDSQGFETDQSGYSHTPSQTPATDPGDQYFYRAEPSDPAIYEGSVGPYTNVTGAWLFVGSNPNTINGGNPGLLTLDPITVTGYSNLEFHADFGACPNDWDASDDLRVEYNFDGGSWATLFYFEAYGDGTNEPLELTGNPVGGINTANGTVLTYALTTISSDNFSGSGSILNIRIVQDAGANYEAFGVDNIQIKGLVSGGVNNPTAFTATTASTTQIDLSWTQNGNSDDVMVAWSSDGTFGTPVDGTSYSVGNTIPGGGTVLYNGSSTSYNHTGLTANTQYYYKAWSVDATPDYSSGVTDDATTLQDEPTNHVASFSAGTPTWNSIPLTWADNDGAVAADGFIIKASTSSTFTDPVDGTPEADDTDMSDGSGQINVTHGVQAYTFTGLNVSTTYYFKIWPYTNSGSDIDYKTDGTVPTDNETTTGPPTTTLPYNEAFGADLGDCYTYSVSGATKEWHWESGGYAAMNGYNTGDVEEDWLVIPGIDLDSYSNEYMTFDTWYNYGTDGPDDYLKLMYSTNYSGTGDPSSATWNDLSYTQPSSSSTWTASGTVDLSTIPGTSVHIAYKYHYNPGVYRSWRVDNISIQESSVDPPPTNYPTAFAASTNSATAITTSWTDATGAQLPAGYLVLANETGTFTDPVDGTPVADDTDMSDDEGAMNVAYGVETYQWTGLSDNTPYYFKIYPYTNSASTIDYKTDGTPPTANATTDEANTDLIISEVVDPDDVYRARFVELYNLSGSTIDFDAEDWYLCRQTNGGSTSWEDKKLTGSILAGGKYVAANYNEDALDYFFTSYGFLADYDYGGTGGNGDDGYFLYFGGDHSTGTLVDAYGEINVDGTLTDWKYEDTKAVRLRSVTTPNATWTANEWDIPSPDLNTTDMTPAAHNDDVTWAGAGTTADDWNEKGGNWSGTYGYIPDASFNVTVPMTTVSPVIYSEAACNDLTLSSDAALDISVNKSLTAYGDLDVASSKSRAAANFTIQSDATGNGSFIGKGMLFGDVTVERYIAAYSSGNDGWHQISSPIDMMDIGSSDFAPGTNDDLYEWIEQTATWHNYKSTGSFTDFVGGHGYLAAYQVTATKHFIGQLTGWDFDFSNLPYTPAQGNGWNLMGNPYPSAIEWDAASTDWALSNIGGVAEIWDESAGNYALINNGDVIPSTNGFFVQATATSNFISIPEEARVHNSTNNYKNSSVETMEETLVLKVTNDENTYYDVNRVGFRADATEAWDIAFDAHKLFGSETAPQLWTVSNDEDFAQNYLPYVYDSYQVPLHFGAGVNSTYHINADGLESFYSNSEIYLEDLFTEEIINLSEQQLYTFTATTDDDEARFVIHFYGVTSTGENPVVENGKIYAYQNTVYVKFNELPSDTYQVEVINMVGQQVYTNEFAPLGLNSFKLNEKPGIYFVRLRAENRTMVQKVMISK